MKQLFILIIILLFLLYIPQIENFNSNNKATLSSSYKLEPKTKKLEKNIDQYLNKIAYIKKHVGKLYADIKTAELNEKKIKNERK